MAYRKAKRRLTALVVIAMTTVLVSGGLGAASFAADNSSASAPAARAALAGPPHAPTSTLTVSSGSKIAGSLVDFHLADFTVKDQDGAQVPHVDVDFLVTFPDGSTEKRVSDSGVYGSGFELIRSSLPGYVTICGLHWRQPAVWFTFVGAFRASAGESVAIDDVGILRRCSC